MSSGPSAFIQILPALAVPAPVWDEVWQLTCRFYAAERAYVEARLRAHRSLALFRDSATRELIGMAAIEVSPVDFDGQRLLMIFTSHTVVDERYRGQNLIQRAGFRTWLGTCLRYPLHRKFWVFDSFSYKSYLLLPRNLVEFWPRFDQPTPAWEATLIEHYGQLKYGSDWRAGGVVARSPRKRLLPQTAPLDARLLAADPNLRFYAERNPGHAEGDMLFCLCPLNARNWWGIAGKVAGRLRKRRV